MIIDDTASGYKLLKNWRGCDIPRLFEIKSFVTMFTNEYDKDYRFEGESHDFWELLIVTAGCLGVTAGSDVYMLTAGMAILHKPLEFHSLWSTGGKRSACIVISFETLNESKALSNEKSNPLSNEKSNPLRVQELFSDNVSRIFALRKDEIEVFEDILDDVDCIFDREDIWVTRVRSGMEVSAQRVANMIQTILISAAHTNAYTNANANVHAHADAPVVAYSNANTVMADNYRRIVNVLEDNLSQMLTLEEIASLSNIGVPNLKKTFKRFSGTGVISYFNIMKINHAIRELRAGTPIKKVSADLGFTDRNYFCTVFKRITGNTPSRYTPTR